jgi:hypothetical protein
MKKYIELVVTDDDIQSIQDLFDAYAIKDVNAEDFLNYNPDNTQKNKERIFNSYSKQQMQSFGITSADQMTESNCNIVAPVLLLLPIGHLKYELKKEDKKKQNKNYNAFLGDEISAIVNNPEFNSGSSTKVLPSIHVWLWCKALSKADDKIEGGLIDVTPFISSLTTNVSETGGNFSMNIDELMIEWNYSLNHWDVKKNSLRGNDSKNILSKGLVFDERQRNAFVGTTTSKGIESLKQKEPAAISYRRNKFLLSTIVSSNDIVFISFDRLSFSEKTTKTSFDGGYRYNLNKQDIPNNVFDMIGLVDVPSMGYSSPNDDVSFSLTGRDCMKLLLDDGTFWFFNSYSNPNDNGVFKNINDGKSGDGVNARTENSPSDTRATNRMFATSWIEAFAIPDPKKIIDVIEIMIATLSNIRVCDDDLFSSYGERRTKYRVLK